MKRGRVDACLRLDPNATNLHKPGQGATRGASLMTRLGGALNLREVALADCGTVSVVDVQERLGTLRPMRYDANTERPASVTTPNDCSIRSAATESPLAFTIAFCIRRALSR